ncbi:MAG TPA: asparagine synthase-related protein [Candidatus Cloacimonadota bacterium]|nr:asparagine synthase-related protein [Candidatus Cloacimonadota bacterium]HPT70909.1 asparagine synthase-related protein [Candidatus Cloacimonadota bacterium]
MKDHRHLFHNDEKIISEDNTQIVVNNIYPTGLPDRIVWHDNLGLIMHGIVFPKDAGIDELAANPDQVFGNMLREYRDKPYLIPFAILNGSYIGVVIDKINRKVFAFTSFLNSIPLYYALLYDTLILSTSYSKISALLEKSIDHVTYGMIEYYQLGTNISALTPIDEIKTVAKGAYLEFDGYRIVHDFYYKMPLNEESRSFDSWVDEFASLWDKSINGLHSHLFKYGLGLTGGIDSRVILAGIKEKEDVLYFTGAHKDNPDYILAKKITASLGLSEHHILEDYTQSNYSQGYLDYLAISDNPIYNNKVYNLDQLKFRADHHLTFELMGLTEFLGGVYHYTDRRKISNMINMSMPLRMHKLDSNSPDSFMNLAFMGLRNTILNDFQSLLSSEQNLEYKNNLQSAIMFLNQQINSHSTLENYLERFRHIHKMANLLSWNRINGRSYVELLSPSMNIDMTDLAARIPLKYRDNRRILLAYLKRYHQRLSKIVLSGYIFSANAPWCLYKGLSPYIKVLNHLGVNIPILQWYMNPNSKQNFIDQRQIRNIQTHVVNESELIKSFIHESEDVNSINSLKLMRLCNLALLEKRLKSDETTYQTYLLELYAIIK